MDVIVARYETCRLHCGRFSCMASTTVLVLLRVCSLEYVSFAVWGREGLGEIAPGAVPGVAEEASKRPPIQAAHLNR